MLFESKTDQVLGCVIVGFVILVIIGMVYIAVFMPKETIPQDDDLLFKPKPIMLINKTKLP